VVNLLPEGGDGGLGQVTAPLLEVRVVGSEVESEVHQRDLRGTGRGPSAGLGGLELDGLGDFRSCEVLLNAMAGVFEESGSLWCFLLRNTLRGGDQG
jgi:hypothetical protein